MGEKYHRATGERNRKSSGRSLVERPWKDLFPRLNGIEKEIGFARERFTKLQRKVRDLQFECKRLERMLEQRQKEVEEAHIESRVSLFRSMVEREHMLRKILTFDASNEMGEASKLVGKLADFLREEGLTLEGDVGEILEMKDEDVDHYELQESVRVLPCKVQVIGRGISYRGRMILRIEVEPMEEDGNGD